MDNIYKLFGEKLTSAEEQGLVPVLFLADASIIQMKQVKRIAVANIVNPKDLRFVPVLEVPDDNIKNAVKTSYVLYAKDEEQAMEVFRSRAAFTKYLWRWTSYGEIPKLFGIDAKGDIRTNSYIPAFNVKGIKGDDLDKIIEYADGKLKSFDRGAVDGRIVGVGVAQLTFNMREKLAGTKDIQNIRKRLLNTICAGVEKKFMCEVERLDDRGGTSQSNICKYLTDLNKNEFLAQSVLVERAARESEVKQNEQQTRN